MATDLDSVIRSWPLASFAAPRTEPVPPARPLPHPPRRDRAVEQGARDAMALARQRQRAGDAPPRESRAPAAAPIVLPRRQPPSAGVHALPFAPFLAQQIAQEVIPDDRQANDPAVARGITAYRTAAGDDSTLLGPVAPRQLVI